MMLCKVCRKNSWDGAVKIFVENSSSPPAGTQAGRLQFKMKIYLIFFKRFQKGVSTRGCHSIAGSILPSPKFNLTK